MKPLFIPLRRKYFEAFAAGKKTEEYRSLGPRWNDRTCIVGRPVVISLGYGKQKRLRGIIIGVRLVYLPHFRLPGWVECYGRRRHTWAVAIKILIHE